MRSRRAFIAAGVIVVAAVVGIAAALALGRRKDGPGKGERRAGGSDVAPSETPALGIPTGAAASAAQPKRKKARKASKEERAKDLFDLAKKEFPWLATKTLAASDPEDFSRAIAQLRRAGNVGRGTRYELMADMEIEKARELWKRAAYATLAKVRQKAAGLAGDGNIDGAIAAVREMPRAYASEVKDEMRAETERLAREARTGIDIALAEAEQLLALGDTKGARAAIKRAEGIEHEAARRATASRVMSVLMKTAEAEKSAGLAAARKAEEDLDKVLSQFDALVLVGHEKGDYAAAKAFAEEAAGKQALSGARASSETLRAAGRVAHELEKRQASMRAGAEALVGRKTTIKTTKGPRRGELEKVTDEGLGLTRTIVMSAGGQEVRKVSRFTVAWEDLAPAQLDEFAADWAPLGADGEIAKALVAIARGDREAAQGALAAAGDHPLARRLGEKVAAAAVADAAPAAPAATAAPTGGSSPGQGPKRPAWPPSREVMQGLFKGRLESYSRATLKVELVYDFADPEQMRDLRHVMEPRTQRHPFEIRHGALQPARYGTYMLLEGVYTAALASVDFRRVSESRPEAGLLACATYDGRGYAFSVGSRSGREMSITRDCGTARKLVLQTSASPLVGKDGGSIVLKFEKGRVAGQAESTIIEAVDPAYSSGRIGLRASRASLDNLRVTGTLDPRWLKALIAVREMGAPHDAYEFGGHWYWSYPSNMSWQEAKSSCRAVGGHLVAPGSAAENAVAAWMARLRLKYGEGWIGLTDERQEGVWEWVTGEPVTFAAWRDNEPSAGESGGNDYAVFYSGSQWRARSATRRVGFVCEWDPAKKAEVDAARAAAAAGGNARTGLLGTYFATGDFGTPLLRRLDREIDFSWGLGAPAPGVPVTDDFSIRWEGTIEPIETGNHVLSVNADDGVALWIGNRKVIDALQPGAGIHRSAPLPLERGKRYLVRIDYVERTMDAHMQLQWAPATVKGSKRGVVVPSRCLRPPRNYERMPGPPIFHKVLADALGKRGVRAPASKTGTGLLGTYFAGTNHENRAAQRLDGPINFTWLKAPAPGVPKDQFSVRWQGFVAPARTGAYTFITSSDDGVRLALAGVVLLDAWSPASKPRLVTAPVELEAGKMYPIRLDFFDASGQASVRLMWRGPGFIDEVVPAARLFPPAGTPARMPAPAPPALPGGTGGTGALPPAIGGESGQGGQPPAPAAGVGTARQPAAKASDAGGWQVLRGESWGNSASVSVTAAEGRETVAVECPAGGRRDKVFVAMASPMSLAGKRTLSFKAKNVGAAPVQVAVAIETGAGYFETMPADLRPGGKAGFQVDLLSKTFKTKATRWGFTSPLQGAADTRRIMLLIYNGPTAASVRFSSFRVR